MKRIKINLIFRLQCSFENSDDSLRVRKVEMESSITKRLRMQHFFRQKNALWSHRDSWGGGSICVKTWCLVESHAQHPDHYPSLSGRNLCLQHCPFGSARWLRGPAQPSRGDLSIQEGELEKFFWASDCFVKVLPRHYQLLPGLKHGRTAFSLQPVLFNMNEGRRRRWKVETCDSFCLVKDFQFSRAKLPLASEVFQW